MDSPKSEEFLQKAREMPNFATADTQELWFRFPHSLIE